jgi:hypothetical protein
MSGARRIYPLDVPGFLSAQVADAVVATWRIVGDPEVITRSK